MKTKERVTVIVKVFAALWCGIAGILFTGSE